uniref:Uncharacterized protein n=1 Tax=Moniliophthora roreri TaxID=221103 RepID=A0A0W0F6C4_MONRR
MLSDNVVHFWCKKCSYKACSLQSDLPPFNKVMSLYQVEFALPIDNTDIDYTCTDSKSKEDCNGNQDADGSQADKLNDEPTKNNKAARSNESFHYESTPLLSKPGPN